MKPPIYILDNDREESLFLKENFFKYFNKWPWFLVSILLCVLVAFLYIRYAPVIYSTEAKVKIIDDTKEFEIATDALSLLNGGSNINLDNEIAIMKSYRLLDQVVTSLNLDVEYFEVGTVKAQQVYNSPVIFTKLFPEKIIQEEVAYKLHVSNNELKITSPEGETSIINSDSLNLLNVTIPVTIAPNKDINLEDYEDKDFLIVLKNKKERILQLIDEIEVQPITDKSDVLSLKIKNESAELSEAILNELINKFNTDGILDRQLVSKRTLNFIDDRFIYLTKELDSIERGKKDYKQSNSLSYIQADAGMTIENKTLAENDVFRIETQIELAKLLKTTLTNQTAFSLLPADIGVDNTSINSLVSQYNQGVLQREKLITSAGLNNPTVQLLSSQLTATKSNIINTVNSYQNQLNISLKDLRRKRNTAGAMFSELPENEKMLRAIERQQSIKENLFLLLLQKREEASINFAVTAPSVKVVDYGLTSIKPISPKKLLILGISLLAGLFIPLAFFFTKFSFDTKVKNKSDLERGTTDIPILGEIPFFKNPNGFFQTNEQSIKAESFRILSNNIKYLLPDNQSSSGHIIFVTSSIKGEGKTLIAFNLAMALTSLNKKVLLIGADLRNPRLHFSFNMEKNSIGLTNFLHEEDINWKDCIHQINDDNSLPDVCLSGPIPPNPSLLLSGTNFKQFLDAVKDEYDYVVVDTAPTIQVADTLLISDNADLTIYIARSGYTDKSLLKFSEELSKTKKLTNMAYVLNDVPFSKGNGYNYGYGYGYGSDEDN